MDNKQETKDFPVLGLVCITASSEVRFRTITRRVLLKLEIKEQEQKLQEIYEANIDRLQQAIAFCQREKIRLYRMSSNLFPFADTNIGKDVLNQLSHKLNQVGNLIQKSGIRLVLHPDQFVVLNSDSPEVIQNSIRILQTHAHIFDLLQLPRSPWALMNIHGGKGNRAERLLETVNNLSDSIRSRLSFENDEHTYSAAEILEICQATKVPMVFDAHHHIIHEELDSYDHPSVGEMLAAAKTTWEVPQWQLVHISNGRDRFLDSKHSDLITQMPSSFRNAPWIEVEAKKKEQAIAKIRQEWLQSVKYF
ncbi:UV-damage endonuclease [Stanieria cyanosphaera PCC 7437]|uniref:UV-damage endonuclease n=1 Tax=Stanieria cyanosphaera (strain ATCC 29371 / PCC 7437) TaxID=111780 RepID=K9XVR6_STAC7|nr:UV DNA damage repair endonuclease UvsE [Stanieria cyanosphaera]AFZ36685.1 UV-damage endonuclease [Stanieria cyanosphaera PCC 7437]